MADPVWVDSQYKFTDPVRYFKSNDPYYWEVDNIPLKELQENVLWLKDQVAVKGGRGKKGGKGDPGAPGITSVKRENFEELQPYVTGGNHVVKVKPGRFTARINSLGGKYERDANLPGGAYSENEPANANEWLALYERTTGYQSGAKGAQPDWFIFASPQVDGANAKPGGTEGISRFSDYVSTSVQNVNGLAERAFTYTTTNADWFHIDARTKRGTYRGVAENNVTPEFSEINPFPVADALLWMISDKAVNYMLKQWWGKDYGHTSDGMHGLPTLENAWIKFWKGVFRTSVVDIPDELEIEVPVFNSADHFYISSKGNKVEVSATQRIDLLFIYTKPVDMEQVDLAKYTGANKTKTTISKPMLGIVKGAGVGIDYRSVNDTSPNPANIKDTKYKSIPAVDEKGNSMILANPSDELSAKNGFENKNVTIHGSFPSPDDLLNISPLIHFELNDENYALIGQTVLPVAYIVVKKDDNVLIDSDIIDIRPFFRTTELAYNERAGIAAAFPQLSFANPAVGDAQLHHETAKLYKYTQSKLKEHERTKHYSGGAKLSPRVVAAGNIFGGWRYGVEQVLSYYYHLQPKYDLAKSRARVAGIYNVDENQIPHYPDWDISRWGRQPASKHGWAGREMGTYPNDRINTSFTKGTRYPVPFGTHITDQGNPSNNETRGSIFGSNQYVHDGVANIHYVKKVIIIPKATRAEWVDSFSVNAKFEHCIPLTSETHDYHSNRAAQAAGIWISKDYSHPSGDWHFTIFVAWAAQDVYPDIVNHGGNRPRTQHHSCDNPSFKHAHHFPIYRRDGDWFAGFMVQTNDMFWEGDHETNMAGTFAQLFKPIYNNQSPVGVAIYPTVSFEVVGYPKKASWPGMRNNLREGTNNRIHLV